MQGQGGGVSVFVGTSWFFGTKQGFQLSAFSTDTIIVHGAPEWVGTIDPGGILSSSCTK